MSSMVALSKIQIPDNIRNIPGVNDLVGTPLSAFPLDEKATILALAQNISEYGLLQPLVVKDLGKGKYRLIAGYRRFKALQHNGSKMVDVKSVKGKTEDEKVLQLIENIHREDLNPMDIALGLESLQRIKNITKQATLAKLVHKSEGWVSQHMSLLKADETVRAAVISGEMGLAAARAISALPKSKQSDAMKDARAEAKAAGKKKVSTKGARRQAVKVKKRKAGKQTKIKPVAEREAEQKEMVCKDFTDVHYGDKKVPKEAKGIVGAFWDYLMIKNRLYIHQK